MESIRKALKPAAVSALLKVSLGRWLPAVAVALALAPLHSMAQPAGYTIIDLGTLGGSSSSASHLNNSGQVAGTSRSAGSDFTHAFLYSNGVMRDLGAPRDAHSFATGINASGQVSVMTNTVSAPFTSGAFMYSNGALRALGTPGDNFVAARGINDLGQVTGEVESGSPIAFQHAVVYSNGALQYLGELPSGDQSMGLAINNAGQVTGVSNGFGNRNVVHAYRYSNGSMLDLGTLGGANSQGNDINGAGDVTGYANLAGVFTVHAFVYSNGVMHDLGSLGDGSSIGSGINNLGQVAGWAIVDVALKTTHGFLYTPGVGMVDLNTLLPAGSGWELSSASDVNDLGQIAGTGLFNGQPRAFLMTPVPESDVWVMMVAGIAVVSAVGRRRGGREAPRVRGVAAG